VVTPSLYPYSKESPREAKPLFFISLPLSFEGEGDKGDEVGKPLIEANEVKRYTIRRLYYVPV
jgi:hypothetical protein